MFLWCIKLKFIDFLDQQNCNGSWEAGGGWFLHPQSNEDVSGHMDVTQASDSESYVGFTIDYEVMAAIRNELLQKLPHAQVIN